MPPAIHDQVPSPDGDNNAAAALGAAVVSAHHGADRCRETAAEGTSQRRQLPQRRIFFNKLFDMEI